MIFQRKQPEARYFIPDTPHGAKPVQELLMAKELAQAINLRKKDDDTILS